MIFKPVANFKVLSTGMAKKIAEAGWPAIDGEIDVAFGCATVDEHCKAVWTKTGKRVEISMNDDVMIVSCSKDVDPMYTEGDGEKIHRS